MIKIIIYFFYICIALHKTTGTIYRLNVSEYIRMPPVYDLDDFDICLNDPEGVYCTMKLGLVSDDPNPLLEMIHEYSEDTTKHFNHSLLYRGVCITDKCKKFHMNTTVDLEVTLEACLNESLWNDYKLKARMEGVISCSTAEKNTINVTSGDITVAVICFGILLVNVVGSLYDSVCTSGKSEDGMRLLIYFSIRRNWRRLVAPAAHGPEPRLRRLKMFYGVRTVTTVLVIIAHSLVPSMIFIDNPYFIENIYYRLESHIFLNGAVVVQTFFIMSGFLLVYNLQLHAEKHEVTYKILPMGILLRYIRLTPPYAVMIALVSTWVRHVGSGPMWMTGVEREVVDCQHYWWHHLLYINNYIDGSQCLLQTWYLAADTQLYILGILVWVVCRTSRTRQVVLSLLAAAGVVFPAIHVYLQDLNGAVLVSPTIANNFYVNDATYDNLYKRGHTNLSGYTLGLALGLVVYRLQQTDFHVQDYRKYRFVYWALPLALVSLILLGSVFYSDRPRHSIIIRMLYATLSKPIYGIVLAIILTGFIFKYENVYRGIAEWRSWTVPGRLSYCASLVHITLIRVFLGSQTTLRHITMLELAQQSLLIVAVSFSAAVPLWMLVESPFGQLIKIISPEPKPIESSINQLEKNKDLQQKDIVVLSSI